MPSDSHKGTADEQDKKTIVPSAKDAGGIAAPQSEGVGAVAAAPKQTAQPTGKTVHKSATKAPAKKGGRKKPAAKKPAGKKPQKRKKKKAPKQHGFIESVAAVAGKTAAGRALGQMLYQLGFFAECKIAWAMRGLRVVGSFTLQILQWLFGGALRRIGLFFGAVWKDLTEPFRRFREGMRNMRSILKEEKKQGGKGQARKKAMDYFRTGTKKHRHLLGNIALFLVPITAGVVFFYTVSDIIGREYNLAVRVNGEVVGYIPDESYFEQARVMLRDRIVAADGRSAEQWQMIPEYSIANARQLTSQPQLVNNILLIQDPDEDDALIEAVGVYIDEELEFATTEIEALDALFASMKEAYRDPEDPDAQPDFVQDVVYDMETRTDLFYSSSVWEFEDIRELVTSVLQEEQRVVANGEDTLSTIAHDNDISLSHLLAYNPGYVEYLGLEEADIEGDILPDAGTSFVVHPQRNYLQVGVTYMQERVEEIPYETIYVESNSIVLGRERVTQPGVNGEQLATYYIEVIDGIRTEMRAEDIDPVILLEPVEEIVSVGTYVQSSGGSGDGVIHSAHIFPVPDYVRSSRGYGGRHYGLDINAPAYTNIYASNGGTVVEAGWHWSYGWHVIIDHGTNDFGQNIQTLYAHMVEPPPVSVADVVSQGQIIGYVGTTGTSTGNHLHYEVREDGVRVDPLYYVSFP